MPALRPVRSLAIGCSLVGMMVMASGCQNPALQEALLPEASRGQMVEAAGNAEEAAPAPAAGCSDDCGSGGSPMPTELCKVSLPAYRIEPPDILLIDTLRLIPLPPYKIESLDVLLINVTPALPNQPISGTYVVAPDGKVNLGFQYGTIQVAGMGQEEADKALREHLAKVINNPQVSVSIIQTRGIQITRGEHLVGPDGTISLGSYGDVYVAGMSRAEAKYVIEKHLSQFFKNPDISLSVYAYNSKVYYIIIDGGGYGQQVYRFASTGNETVLDAISNISGLPAVASKRKIWVARPAPPYAKCDQVLPVDWSAIVEGGSTKTNYQLFPGDRIYIKADCLIAFDNALAKILAPAERLFGITLLGATTINQIKTNPNIGANGFNNGLR